MQNLKSVAALGEELRPDIVKWKTTIFRKSCFLQEKLALRGSLAVTWLTVYRQLQVLLRLEEYLVTRRASTVLLRLEEYLVEQATVWLFSERNTS